LLQQLLQCDHTRPCGAREWHNEVVFFGLDGKKSEARATGDSVERHSPISPALCHSRRYGIVVPRLHGIPARLDAAQ
jgi:hypothetical protein